jgi:hypothetical protein
MTKRKALFLCVSVSTLVVGQNRTALDSRTITIRTAYADQHFRCRTFAGSKTDRGQVYIAFGPPDGISAHTREDGSFPYETWRYRDLPGVGTNVDIEFIDVTLTGEYRMAVDLTEKRINLVTQPADSSTGDLAIKQFDQFKRIHDRMAALLGGAP